jgi:hypothetical protein
MTEMYDRAILEQLQQATIAAVAASTVPALPIKHLVATGAFTIPDDQKWLEIVWIPNNRRGDYWGNEKNYTGMFRLVLHWPNDGAGAYGPMNVLASVCSYFDKERRLQNVMISANPDSGGVIEQGAENLYPAMLRYQCFRP